MRHTNLVRDLYRIVYNRLILPVHYPVVEWEHAGKHLVHDDTDSPAIDTLVILFSIELLWGIVVWCSSCCSFRLTLSHGKGKTEIDELEIAVLVEHDVLQLDIAVHDTLLMQLDQSKNNLGHVEFYLTFRKLFFNFE